MESEILSWKFYFLFLLIYDNQKLKELLLAMLVNGQEVEKVDGS